MKTHMLKSMKYTLTNFLAATTIIAVSTTIRILNLTKIPPKLLTLDLIRISVTQDRVLEEKLIVPLGRASSIKTVHQTKRSLANNQSTNSNKS